MPNAEPRQRAPLRPRAPNDREKAISTIVGKNLRALRVMKGMSQTTLADKLGLTFQQVQKYEAGTNRVSAPKLLQMAEIFDTPISAFFSNTGTTLPKDGVDLPLFGKQGLQAARLVEALPPHMQTAAIRFLRSLSESEGE